MTLNIFESIYNKTDFYILYQIYNNFSFLDYDYGRTRLWHPKPIDEIKAKLFIIDLN